MDLVSDGSLASGIIAPSAAAIALFAIAALAGRWQARRRRDAAAIRLRIAELSAAAPKLTPVKENAVRWTSAAPAQNPQPASTDKARAA